MQAAWLQTVENPIFKYNLSWNLGLGEQTNIEYALQADSEKLLFMSDALLSSCITHFMALF